MELRVLKYFLAVAREGSVTAAAHSMHVTQPTLSRQLQELEEELGQKLFIRSNNHNAVLTPEGTLLRKRAEDILDMVHKTENEFSAMGEDIAGDIYIGGGESDAMRRILRGIKNLQEEHPNIRCHVYSGNTEDVMDKLDYGMLDFGVLVQPVDVDKYNHITLPDEDVWGVLMRKDHPLAELKQITPEDLRQEPLICSRYVIRRSGVKNHCAQWFGKEFSRINVVATYNLIFNAALMVEEGIGCALVMDKLAEVQHHRNLCFRQLSPRLTTGLELVWKKQQFFSAASELFLERLRVTLPEKQI